ncbi:MAG: DUF1501 domain-containing protein [Verrucomicrobiota bacterium]|jgi:hypothetical protein|nr:DUF1501 domain-containing protein [Verrucomicrobiota bacterium]MDP7050801.1 DUF1501 domain-containing protein [Verrucomicrobiota bacterium]
MNDWRNSITRRDMLKCVSTGFGYMAFAGLSSAHAASGSPLLPKPPHFRPKAKRVIFACMRGGPSHVDTFDHKPALARDNGKQLGKYRNRELMASPWEFAPHGQSGLMISELFPNLARHADDLCLLNGMYASVPAHPQSFIELHTGSFQFVRPSMGAWVLYGLGSENQNLPGFISLGPPSNVGGAQNYGSAFLPAYYQGTKIGEFNRPLRTASLRNLSNEHVTGNLQRKQLDFLQSLNRDLLTRKRQNSQVEGVIESYELAFRMQSAVPELMNTRDETQATLDAYGIGNRATENFGNQCLLARRLAEAGVRFIEISQGNWDQHRNLNSTLTRNCEATDQPLAALLRDLKERGLLEETLVVWGGEFGRTPHAKQKDGRDHNATGFTFWMAGGGVKGGITHGSTDEHGITAVTNRMHFHDLHATILHLLGLDHEGLTYQYAGRDFRLTDVHGNVAHDIIA